ncbi:hypothetical protein AAMO2058_001721000 [Amorphochlora amoebiformis]
MSDGSDMQRSEKCSIFITLLLTCALLATLPYSSEISAAESAKIVNTATQRGRLNHRNRNPHRGMVSIDKGMTGSIDTGNEESIHTANEESIHTANEESIHTGITGSTDTAIHTPEEGHDNGNAIHRDIYDYQHVAKARTKAVPKFTSVELTNATFAADLYGISRIPKRYTIRNPMHVSKQLYIALISSFLSPGLKQNESELIFIVNWGFDVKPVDLNVDQDKMLCLGNFSTYFDFTCAFKTARRKVLAKLVGCMDVTAVFSCRVPPSLQNSPALLEDYHTSQPNPYKHTSHLDVQISSEPMMLRFAVRTRVPYPIIRPHSAKIEENSQTSKQKSGKKHNLVACSSFHTGYDKLNELMSWLAYNRAMGVDHFVLYDWAEIEDYTSANNQEMLKAWILLKKLIRPWIDKGYLTYIPWAQDSRTRAPPLIITEFSSYVDCVQRYRHSTVWITNPHIDEYLSVGPSFSTIPQVLNTVDDTIDEVRMFEMACRASKRQFLPKLLQLGNIDYVFKFMQESAICPDRVYTRIDEDRPVVSQPAEGIIRADRWLGLTADTGAFLTQKRGARYQYFDTKQLYYRHFSYGWVNSKEKIGYMWIHNLTGLDLLGSPLETEYAYRDRHGLKRTAVKWIKEEEFGRRFRWCVKAIFKASGDVPTECIGGASA